jgi:hypothetical protein
MSIPLEARISAGRRDGRRVRLFRLRGSAIGGTLENNLTIVTDLPFYVFILVVCWAPVDLDPREMVTPGSFNR